MKRLLHKHTEISDLTDRIKYVVEKEIKEDYVNHLVDSMPKRLAEVVRTKRNITDY